MQRTALDPRAKPQHVQTHDSGFSAVRCTKLAAFTTPRARLLLFATLLLSMTPRVVVGIWHEKQPARLALFHAISDLRVRQRKPTYVQKETYYAAEETYV